MKMKVDITIQLEERKEQTMKNQAKTSVLTQWFRNKNFLLKVRKRIEEEKRNKLGH